MSKFSVLILGSASAAPTLTRNQTSQLINIDEQYFLMDCGEGTQLRLREHKIKIQRINHIFISHLHGDHYLGLIGLIQTMHLLGRTSELTIYCPSNIQEIVEVNLRISESHLRYPIVYKAVDAKKSELVYENEKIEVISIPLNHRIACSGYLFKEKPKRRRINPKAVSALDIPKYQINKIKLGEDYVSENGEIIKNRRLTLNSLPSFSYAFCSDTKYYEQIIPIIKDVDLLYHEATFSDEHSKRADKTYHSTAKQAAKIAAQSGAKRLIIGHFSNRYSDLNILLEEAKMVFEKTEIAEEGRAFDVSFPQ
jgi:ribonuclease Z